ncbi:CHAD domain-containing protein [Streptomyces harbinensis]|uniref:CHAD domain-containing protein n=1 Tax=Streptomyces harbinensis TaxID=1176198 RepID=UPI00339A3782
MAVGGASGTERTDGATGPLPEMTGTGPVAAVRRPAGDPELPAGSAGERVLEHLGRQVRLITGLDAAVRRREPDSVHRMRVATRRLRGTLRSQWAVLDRRRTRAVADELRWLAGELGTDRDREVLAERLGERVAELPGELRRGPLERRVAAYTAPPPSGGAAVRALESERYRALRDALAHLLAAPPLRADAHAPAGPVLAAALRRDVRRLERRLAAARRTPPGRERDIAWHRARKAAKRARYAAEIAGREKRAAKLRRVQRILGRHQDSVLVRAALPGIAEAAEAAGEPSFSYGLLYGRERELAEGYEREL